MAEYLELHPQDPQPRLIRKAAEIVRAGGVIAYPTDSCYALGCHIGDKDALERIRRIRAADKHHHFTLVCRDLAEIGRYARVDTPQFRLLKSATPGPFTFLLPATRETPKRLQHPKRRTIGIRVPAHRVPHLLLAELAEPLLSSTLLLPGDELPLTDGEQIRERLEHQIDAVLDGGHCGVEPTTVVDLTVRAADHSSTGQGQAGPSIIRPMFSSPQTGKRERVLSGMRPTGKLHLGNYHGALRNWVALQDDYEGYFFVADWHALTTDYENTAPLQQYVHELVVDWLAAGLDPDKAAIFLQSDVMAHAELHLLLSMITPLSWLERVPTFKDQQAQLKEKDLATYGFLGYPLLQSADILIYRPAWVPVGEDQVAHVEITREIARRFNHIFGKDGQFPKKVKAALSKFGPARDQYAEWRRRFQQDGDTTALAEARALVAASGSLADDERDLLLANLEGEVHRLLPAPEALLTPTPRVPGLDGRKMSKSYGNTIGLTEDPASIEKKIKGMTTDPARARRNDPGNPEKCPVWDLHKLYSSEATRAWVREGCTTAGIGCIECKKPVWEKVCAEATAMRERAAPYINNPGRVREILVEGSKRAGATAEATMQVVRQSMNLLPAAARPQ